MSLLHQTSICVAESVTDLLLAFNIFTTFVWFLSQMKAVDI